VLHLGRSPGLGFVARSTLHFARLSHGRIVHAFRPSRLRQPFGVLTAPACAGYTAILRRRLSRSRAPPRNSPRALARFTAGDRPWHRSTARGATSRTENPRHSESSYRFYKTPGHSMAWPTGLSPAHICTGTPAVTAGTPCTARRIGTGPVPRRTSASRPSTTAAGACVTVLQRVVLCVALGCTALQWVVLCGGALPRLARACVTVLPPRYVRARRHFAAVHGDCRLRTQVLVRPKGIPRFPSRVSVVSLTVVRIDETADRQTDMPTYVRIHT
jgi:hypothetical protein